MIATFIKPSLVLNRFGISNQTFYNDKLIEVKNPEVRQVFTQLRDDEMRAVVELQQKVERLEAPPGIIAKFFPTKPIWGSSLFFVLGPVLVIGMLLAQYHPHKNWLRMIYVFVIAGLFSAEEMFLISRNVLEYLNWHYTDSIVVNISAMTTLSWFSMW